MDFLIARLFKCSLVSSDHDAKVFISSNRREFYHFHDKMDRIENFFILLKTFIFVLTNKAEKYLTQCTGFARYNNLSSDLDDVPGQFLS